MSDEAEQVEKQLSDLLLCKEEDIKEYQAKVAQHLKKITNPVTFFKNFIEKKADDENYPNDFSFYDFWERLKPLTKLLSNNVQNAHVKVQLYKHCLSAENIGESLNSKEHMCPPVYIRCGKHLWMRYSATNSNVELCKMEKNSQFPSELSWMDDRIRDYILKNSDIVVEEELLHMDFLRKHTLYWAVLNDDTDVRGAGEKLGLGNIRKTQVYVGKAEKGIEDRWIKNSKSHCKKMFRCLEEIRETVATENMKYSHMKEIENLQLVDARLLLSKLRGKETALFLVKIFDDPKMVEEGLKRVREEIPAIQTKVNECISNAVKPLQRQSQDIDEAVEKLTESLKHELGRKLDWFIRRVDHVSQPTVALNNAEARHIDGQLDNFDTEASWAPKKMGYGMNMRVGSLK